MEATSDGEEEGGEEEEEEVPGLVPIEAQCGL